jgi:hypothetical protein
MRGLRLKLPQWTCNFAERGWGCKFPHSQIPYRFPPDRQGRPRRHGSTCSAVPGTLIYLILPSNDGARSIAAIAEKPDDIRDRHGQFGARSTQ